jgi:hypothetical protein
MILKGYGSLFKPPAIIRKHDKIISLSANNREKKKKSVPGGSESEAVTAWKSFRRV